MHLFIIDYYISFDTLSPIAYYLKKNRENVYVYNFNVLQDFSENKIMKYLISMKIKYLPHQPLNSTKLVLYYLLKLFIRLSPKFILKRCTRLWFYLKRDVNFLSEKKLEDFFVKNNVKTLTISENFPIDRLKRIYLISKKNNVRLILVPSGLALNEQEYYSKKLNFCDKYLQCNNKLKFENLEEKNNNNNKLINVGSARYDDEWLEVINSIFRLGQNQLLNKQLKIAFFVKKGSHWGENKKIENLIEKLKENKDFQVSVRNKPSDIYPNKISVFMNDKFNSSQIIDWCDIVISGRPSSILVECIKKNKEVLILDTDNIIKTNFYNYKIFKKMKFEDVNEYLKSYLNYKVKINESDKKKFFEDFITYESNSLKYHLEKAYLTT
tara:strand:- start:10326 stop:11471 length:1146 start_codon:yes stop_codon:yes gene_type:complete